MSAQSTPVFFETAFSCLANFGESRRAGGVGSPSGRFNQIVAAEAGPSISGTASGLVAGRRTIVGFLCVARSLFVGVECEAGLDEPPPLLGAALDGALAAGVSAGELLLARLPDSEDASAGAAVRAGEGALSSAAWARAGVRSALVVVVASVVVSVDVESAAPEAEASADADVASSDEFICANLSPATAVNAAPAKNRAAYTNMVAVRRLRGSDSGCSSAADSCPYSQLSLLKRFRRGIAFVAPCFERPRPPHGRGF